MKRVIVLLALAVLGIAAGTAFAAYVSTTSNGPNTFTTRAIPSKPVITGPRITADPSCGVNVPNDTVRQGGTFYLCAQSVTDPAGVASVTADVTPITGNPSVPLISSGGPFGGYTYRSAALTADTPLDTGTTGSWSIKATNNNGDRSTLNGNTYNVRSFRGFLLGEFGAPATTSLSQYYRFSEATGTGPNLGTGGTASMTYNGTPTRRVPGALVGETDTAVQLNGATDYLSGTRRVTGDFSATIWVKGSDTSGAGPGTTFADSAGLVDAGTTANTNDWGVAVDATGRIVAGCGNNATATVRSPAGALTDGNWHQFVFTRVRTTGAIKLYADGALIDSKTTCSTTTTLAGSGTLWFGRSHESSLYLTATLDDPVIFQRELTLAEVQDLYELGTGTG